MKPGTSLLLDVVRVLAALGVFVSHCFLPWFSSFPGVPELYREAHGCVIVFFVLSGYVIAYTTLERRRKWQDYCAARLARVYSVVLPSLMATVGLLVVGRHLAPDHYLQFDRGFETVRVFLAMFFLNEVWFLSSAPPTNLPFWSMAYEVWYYAIFGLLIFVRPAALRVLVVVAACVLCGPKTLLLLPVWLSGVAAYLAGRRFAFSRPVCIGLFAVLAAAVWLLSRLPVRLEGFGQAPLFYSGLFAHDWGWGVLFAAAIFVFDQFAGRSAAPLWVARCVRRAAGVTFSIYLLHMPLLIFVAGVLPYRKDDPIQVGLAAVLVLLITVIFGAIFERRDLLKALTKNLERLIFRGTAFSLRWRQQLCNPT